MPIAFSMLPPLPMRMPFWLSRSTRIEASMRTSSSSSWKESIDHARAVRDLLARQAQDLLAHHLRHEEALGLVGEEVLGIERLAFRQVGEQPLGEQLHVLAGEGGDGHHLHEVQELRGTAR